MTIALFILCIANALCAAFEFGVGKPGEGYVNIIVALFLAAIISKRELDK